MYTLGTVPRQCSGAILRTLYKGLEVRIPADIKIFHLQCRLYFIQIVSIFFKVVKLLFFKFSFKIFFKISTTNSNNMHKNSRRNDATDHQSCY